MTKIVIYHWNCGPGQGGQIVSNKNIETLLYLDECDWGVK